jgi:hypothetical protein
MSFEKRKPNFKVNPMRAIQIKNSLLLLAAVLALFAGTVRGQNSPQQKEDIETRRIGFITHEVQLTPQEAQAFWPVYNRYHAELDALRKKKQCELLSSKVNFDSYSDEQLSKLLDAEMDQRQKELELQIRYNAEFRKVLPVKKVARLYRAEQQFKVNLIRDMKQNNPAQGSRQGGAPGQQKRLPNR